MKGICLDRDRTCLIEGSLDRLKIQIRPAIKISARPGASWTARSYSSSMTFNASVESLIQGEQDT